MASQLRIYEINPGELDAFTRLWREEIVPLREQFGFVVRGAWFSAQRSQFAWVVSHPDFEAAAEAYYASPARTALSRDPADFIRSSDLRMFEDVAP